MFFLKLLSRLPLSVLYGFSNFLFVVTYRVLRYRRKIVWRNLTYSFPERSIPELRNIEKEYYRNLCDYGVETLKLLTMSKEQLMERMVYTNPDLVLTYKNNNQSVIMLASHQFNWEWLLAAGNLYLPYDIDFVYQPVQSELFDQFSLQSRTRFGAYPIKRNELARESLKRRNILRGIAIVADQYPGHENDKRVEIEFLNQPTMFFLGANQLAQLTQYPVVFAHITKVKRGYYQMELKKIYEPPYEKEDKQSIVNYARAVEALIRENPSGWLWSHNRWKTRHLE